MHMKNVYWKKKKIERIKFFANFDDKLKKSIKLVNLFSIYLRIILFKKFSKLFCAY